MRAWMADIFEVAWFLEATFIGLYQDEIISSRWPRQLKTFCVVGDIG
jgi:hypothetical protein